MKKVLFIDRDGTLVVEPPIDYQLDSLEKLEFIPYVFQALSRIVTELDFELVIVSNQDGLGTESFPEETFWPAHKKMIQAFKNEGIEFSDILIDKSLPEDNASTRKPGIDLLQKYIYGPYDMANSFVIGDRPTDMQLADNLKCQGIFIGNDYPTAALSTTNWNDIYRFLKEKPRVAEINRTTKETNISVKVNLDGSGKSEVNTGIGFFDHMLDQISRHGNMDLNVTVSGDLEIDEHHTIEDVAICFGQAIKNAIGTKKGIERYGYLLPMDDCLAQVAIDLGGRPWFKWNATFQREMVGQMPTEMFSHFFKSFSDNAECNLNIKAEGTNEHHKIESIFKAFAKSLNMSARQSSSNNIPSTKGTL